MDNDSVNGILMMDDSVMRITATFCIQIILTLMKMMMVVISMKKGKKAKAKQDSDIRYKKLLSKLESSSEVRLRNLEMKVKNVRNYDNILEKIRPVAIKELLHLEKNIYYDSRRLSGNKEK